MRIVKYTESRVTYVCLILGDDKKYYDVISILNFKDEFMDLDDKKCTLYHNVISEFMSSTIKAKHYNKEDINKYEVVFKITIKPQDYESMEAYYADIKKLSEECIDILEQIKNEILIKKYL